MTAFSEYPLLCGLKTPEGYRIPYLYQQFLSGLTSVHDIRLWCYMLHLAQNKMTRGRIVLTEFAPMIGPSAKNHAASFWRKLFARNCQTVLIEEIALLDTHPYEVGFALNEAIAFILTPENQGKKLPGW